MDDAQDQGPTAERLRRGPVEHNVEVIAYDRDERPSRALVDRAVGLIERMARRGTISDEMAEAALKFRTDFDVGHLQPLRAASMRERTGPGHPQPEIGWRAVRARQRVLEAVGAVGEPGGSCLWAVVGEERTIKDWALTTRQFTQETASGVLISALGALKSHYRL